MSEKKKIFLVIRFVVLVCWVGECPDSIEKAPDVSSGAFFVVWLAGL